MKTMFIQPFYCQIKWAKIQLYIYFQIELSRSLGNERKKSVKSVQKDMICFLFC